MNKPARFADRLCEVGSKRDDVMVGRLFDLVDAFNSKLSTRLNLFQRITRDRAHLGMDLADSDLHVQPFLKFVLLRPERAHFGQYVTRNHFYRICLSNNVFISTRWSSQNNAPATSVHCLLSA